MLSLDTRVPSALILPEPIDNLQTHLTAQNAHWFRAEPESVVPKISDKPPCIEALLSCTSKLRADQTDANKNNTSFGPEGDDPGLEFKQGLHCGYMIPDIALDARNWSAAVRFVAPKGDARTLLTLSPDTVDNYMFLYQVMGDVLFKDQQNTLECKGQVGAPTSEPSLIVVGMSDNLVWLRVNGGPVLVSPQDAEIDLSGALTFFIGCRNNKARLLKTLGHFFLHDVVIWPDRNVLEAAHKDTRTALGQAGLWRA